VGQRNYEHPLGISLHAPVFHGGNTLPPHYGAYAMILVYIGETSCKIGSFEKDHNAENLRADLDLIHEIREEARVREEATKERANQRYHSRVRARLLHKGDLL